MAPTVIVGAILVDNIQHIARDIKPKRIDPRLNV